MRTNAYRNLIGFENMFDDLAGTVEKYPPYNVFREEGSEADTILELALAGFNKEDISVVLDDNKLIIESKSIEEVKVRKYTHRGISRRAFRRVFQLAEHQKVTDVEMINGVLALRITKVIPEELRPRTLNIS